VRRFTDSDEFTVPLWRVYCDKLFHEKASSVTCNEFTVRRVHWLPSSLHYRPTVIHLNVGVLRHTCNAELECCRFVGNTDLSRSVNSVKMSAYSHSYATTLVRTQSYLAHDQAAYHLVQWILNIIVQTFLPVHFSRSLLSATGADKTTEVKEILNSMAHDICGKVG